jgi:hypothetical protein
MDLQGADQQGHFSFLKAGVDDLACLREVIDALRLTKY